MKRFLFAAVLIAFAGPAMAQQMMGPAFNIPPEQRQRLREQEQATQADWERSQAWKCGPDPITPHECAQRIEDARQKDMWARARVASDEYKATHEWAREDK